MGKDRLLRRIDQGSAPRASALSGGSSLATPTSAVSSNADTVDGFHASATPTAGWLLALGVDGKFPISAIPDSASPTTIQDFPAGLRTAFLENYRTEYGAGGSPWINALDNWRGGGSKVGLKYHATGAAGSDFATTSALMELWLNNISKFAVGYDGAVTATSFNGITGLASTTSSLSVGATGASGSGATAARNDHAHTLARGTPSALSVGGSNAAGSSGDFAGADHLHQIPTGLPTGLNVGGAANAGSSTSFPRLDHQHSISRGTPGANSVNLAASSGGNASTFAAGDHTHQLDQSIVPTWTGPHTFGNSVGISGANTLTFGGDATLYREAVNRLRFNAAVAVRVGGLSTGFVSEAPLGHVYAFNDNAGGVGGTFIGRTASDASTPNLYLDRACGTHSAPTQLTAGQTVGLVGFRGYIDGNYRSVTRIQTYVDGTPSATSWPGRIAFMTVADGSTALTERWWIRGAGHLHAATDNAYDIGTATNYRPRNIYVAGSIGVGTAPSALLHALGTTEQFRLSYDANSYFSALVDNGSTTTLATAESGNLVLAPGGSSVLPRGSAAVDLGDYNRMWRTLYVSELYAETLVAQDVMATIGGRIMVAPTTALIADLSSAALTMDVEHNNLPQGGWVILKSAPGGIPQTEVIKLAATAPIAITGGYRYTITARNEDLTNANNWVAGDAVASLGATAGQGYIDLTSTSTIHNHLGPTMAIYSRNGAAAWNDIRAVVALGNLRSFVDYTAADAAGLAIGNDLTLTPTTGFKGLTADRAAGVRLFNVDLKLYNGATQTVGIESSGRARFGSDLSAANTTALAVFPVAETYNGESVAAGSLMIGSNGGTRGNVFWDRSDNTLNIRSGGTRKITFASDGDAYFSGIVGIGQDGELRQGDGTFGAGAVSGFTGFRIWRDLGTGRGLMAGYKLDAQQWYVNTDGKLTAGAGAVILDASGLSINAGNSNTTTTRLKFLDTAAAEIGYVVGYNASGGAAGGEIVRIQRNRAGSALYNAAIQMFEFSSNATVAISGSGSGASVYIGGANSAASPTIAFGNDTSTGFYRPNTATLGISAGGTLAAQFTSTTATIKTTLRVANWLVSDSHGYFLDMNGDAAYARFFTSASAALPIKVGGLIVSDNYGDTGPANGAFIKGNAVIGGNLQVDTNTLFVNATDNRVGIGTTAPTRSLSLDNANVYLSFNYLGTEKWVLGNEQPNSDRFIIYNAPNARYDLIINNGGAMTTSASVTAGSDLISAGDRIRGSSSNTAMRFRRVTLATATVTTLTHASGNGAGTKGVLFISNSNGANSAIFALRGGSNATAEIADPGNVYVASSAPPAGSTGIYFGGVDYLLYNNTGVQQTYDLFFFVDN